MGVAEVRQALPDGAVEGGRGVGRGLGSGKSAVLQSGKCCAFPTPGEAGVWRYKLRIRQFPPRWHCSLLCNIFTVLVNNWGWQDGGGMV